MKLPKLIGIVNLTPDSFSGDGRLGEAALAHAAQLVEMGADGLDLGAESTRPGATPIDPLEEWKRLGPILERAVTQPWRQNITLSVDTYHPETAARALDFGADIINDPSGLRNDAMRSLLAQRNCGIVVMHALTVPADSACLLPATADPIKEVLQWKDQLLKRSASVGIRPDRLIFDPGIGFGKTPTQSLRLLIGARELVASSGRWYFGHSRKSFLRLLGDEGSTAADALTLAFSAQLAAAGVDYLRIHDVKRHRHLWQQLNDAE